MADAVACFEPLSNAERLPNAESRLCDLRGPGLELDAVPLLHGVPRRSVVRPLLLEHVQAAEFFRAHLDAVHGPAAARDILHHELRGRELRHQQVPDLGFAFREVRRLLWASWGRRRWFLSLGGIRRSACRCREEL